MSRTMKIKANPKIGVINQPIAKWHRFMEQNNVDCFVTTVRIRNYDTRESNTKNAAIFN
jgi:hypothetical protein